MYEEGGTRRAKLTPRSLVDPSRGIIDNMEQKDNMDVAQVPAGALASQVEKDTIMTSMGQGHNPDRQGAWTMLDPNVDTRPHTLQGRQPDSGAGGDGAGDLLAAARAAAVSLQGSSLAATNQIQRLIQRINDLESENAALKQELAAQRVSSRRVPTGNPVHSGVQETAGVTSSATDISRNSSTVAQQANILNPTMTAQRTPPSGTCTPSIGGAIEHPPTTGSSYHGNSDSGHDEHTSSSARSNQEKLDEYARFLAGKILPGDQSKNLLREFDLSEVDLQDLEAEFPLPRDQRIQGIRKGIQALGTHSAGIKKLLKKLSNVGLRSVAEDFCSKFGLEPLQSKRAEPVLPVAQNKFEKALAPHLVLPRNLHQLTALTRDETALSRPEVQKFVKAMSSWNESQLSSFRSVESNGALLSILEGWSSVTLEQHNEHVPEDRVENLVRCLRDLRRTPFLQKLKEQIKNGVVGPFLARNTYLRNMPYSVLNEVARKLNIGGVYDWKHLADSAGFTISQIEELQSNSMREVPAVQFFNSWKTKNVTVSNLYDWAVKVDRSDVLEILEREKQ
ncbi:uncharacterized protein [Diadema antillarum]|uniref:uncharacterized protein n=1 Tax=Diadema antillarum TaxID=105358 RepID=UPI003A889640